MRSDQPFALALVANATGIVNVKICVSKEGRVVCMGGQGMDIRCCAITLFLSLSAEIQSATG
ncbi:MAG: hypothetical protein U0Y68_22220 [Blastocatellia bacterium]